MRGLRGTLILAVIVAGLAYTLSQVSSDKAGPDLTESALDDRSLLQADTITVRSQIDVAPIEMRRTAGYEFELTEPVRDLASVAKLREIASAWDTAQLAPAHKPEDVTDDLLSQIGLDQPRGELTLEYPDHRVSIEIGDDGPLGRDVFVRKDGRIYWASKALYTALEGTVDDYRERRVFLSASSQVRELRIVRHPEGADPERLVLRQQQAGRYRLTEPINARAHLAGAESFVQSVLGITVGIFMRGEMLPQPKPDWEIEVDGQLGIERLRLWRQPNTMLLGIQEPRQLVFLIEDREYSRMFDVPAKLLRSELLVPISIDDIAHVKLDPGAGGRAAVLRRGTLRTMELEGPVRAATQATAVTEMFAALSALKAAEFLDGEHEDLGAFGLGEGHFTVEVKGAMDPRPIAVHLGREDGDFCYARRADESTVVKIDAAAARALRRPWVDYVDRDIYRYPAINVVGLVLSRGEDRRSYALTDGSWLLEGGSGTVNSDDVESVVETLTHLDARKVLDPEVVGDLASVVTIELKGLQNVVLQQMQMARRDDRTLLWLPARELVYELRDTDAAALWALAPR